LKRPDVPLFVTSNVAEVAAVLIVKSALLVQGDGDGVLPQAADVGTN
jgi:hypothetical protein